MTTNRDPEEIRAEIARTRAALSDDVDELAQSARPQNVARRQVGRVKGAVGDVKDRVMGSDGPSAGDRLSSTAAAAGDRIGATTSAAGDAVAQAPDAVKARTQGNPIAAGLIAFGAGLLVSSLIPSSQKEQRAVSQLQDNLEPLKEQVTAAAQEVVENVREPAKEAAESVKATASEGVENVRQEGAGAADDIAAQAEESKDAVQQAR